MPTAAIVHPDVEGAATGNRTTAERWARLLENRGWTVRLSPDWDGGPCDVLIALHARKSHAAVARIRRERPEIPVVVAGAGTDLECDLPAGDADTLASFQSADRIVVFHDLAPALLPQECRARCRVIHQSVELDAADRANVVVVGVGDEPPASNFDVAFVANLRAVKDPATVARASAALPPESRVRILHFGAVIEPEVERELAALRSPRFVHLGTVPHAELLARVSRARLLVSSSRQEGGANCVSEALALGVPVLASHITGSLGLLGEDYPGTFPTGDAETLAALLRRAERDAAFLNSLREACARRAWITEPEREAQAWIELLRELVPDSTS